MAISFDSDQSTIAKPYGSHTHSELRRSPEGHVAPLDGLRAIAVGGVVAAHCGVPGFRAGWLGVDLFFVISGFLITTLLLNECSRKGRISLKNFWARRFLRLMPAYYLYILGITIAIWFWPGSIRNDVGSWNAYKFTMALWTYLVNYASMGGIWNGEAVTIHLWSLAVEEQYYFFWPLLLVVLLRYPRSVHVVPWMLATGVYVYFIFFATDFERQWTLHGRGISLFFASALAVSLFFGKDWVARHARRLRPQVVASIAVLATLVGCAAAFPGLTTEYQVRYYFLPGLVIIYSLLVAALWYSPVSGLMQSVLCNPVLAYIGKISYGIYLYHQLVRELVWWATENIFGGMPQYPAYGLRLVFSLGLTLGLASASFHFYEKRFTRLKTNFY